MRVPALIAALLVLASCQTEEFAGTAYGEPLTLSKVTPIDRILASPDRYVGERVLVEGTVSEVCDQMGCWMDIQGDADGGRIQVKVDDGAIVFPVTASGSRARVEGIVERLERSHEEAVAAAQHRADEQGEDFDPATVTGPETVVRLQGTGAIISG